MSEAYFPVESGALGPENFLSLDDILMSQEKLPVRVETPMPRLGAFFLERGAGAEADYALPQGTKLELPLWLAKGLFDNKRRILSVEIPKIYQEGWRTVFSADANVVDLHKMGPHFYGFGSQLLHFDSPESADISQSLLQAPSWALQQHSENLSQKRKTWGWCAGCDGAVRRRGRWISICLQGQHGLHSEILSQNNRSLDLEGWLSS
ncbi:DNA replication complex GINS protein PSF3 isoform X2 [Mesocricetus auratus]|uniref:DNA replication complex GINS protein PSF3 n=1 Tax=Mesocricetus auratus TaxID=10036 RepID=A0ABM2X1D9_MESAU|nr:DNA replication complex GINS protein PSF3 isoform X2 [Mesocricetus auratus]